MKLCSRFPFESMVMVHECLDAMHSIRYLFGTFEPEAAVFEYDGTPDAKYPCIHGKITCVYCCGKYLEDSLTAGDQL